jgi:MiaB-like tRNA modifying enzyme
MARYYLDTYGCTANRGESRAIERRLRDGGHRPVDSPDRADVAILNTCTVVEKTEDNMLRRARELAEETADLVVTGCMALAQDERFREAGIDARVLGWDEVPTAVGNGECPTATPESQPVLDGVIGILPIARGCANDCSYCITKFATGRIDSPSVETNVDRARELLDAGASEIRITGQDTGVYGWDAGEQALPDLLERIASLDGDFRIRLGMANPRGVYPIREELASVFAEHDSLYNFLHLPVQSGSDDVLADMRRGHTVSEFREIVETFDAHLEEWTLSTDFIVGFPTETAADYRASLDLLEAVRPESLNVTRFSKRPGTEAASMKGLGGTLKKERSREMSEQKQDIVGEAYESLVGTRRSVHVVEPGRDGSMQAADDAYHQIVVSNAVERGIEPGEFVTVEITDHRTVYAIGDPI